MRMRGVKRLRVCDLSAMPNINAGNTNAPSLMLGRPMRGLHLWRLV
jgi:choline dehydrogenase-like flavoprotein